MVGDEGADAAHMRLEGLNEFQVLGQTGRGLVGRAYHKAAAHLEADVLQVLEALHPVCKGHGSGVELLIMRLVRRLVAEQVAVCTGVKHLLVLLSAVLAQRESHGAVWVARLDGGHQGADPGDGEDALAPLEDEGAEAQLIALGTAGEDVLIAEQIALAGLVGLADAAVVAVVAAVAGHFDKAAEENIRAVDRLPDGYRLLGGVRPGLLALRLNERLILSQRQAVLLCQTVEEGDGVSHDRSRWNRRS